MEKNDYIRPNVTSEDLTSQNNICTKDPSNLIEITLKEIEPWKIQKDTILWLRLFTDSFKISAVNLHGMDKNGDVICLILYN
jgi:hypothetical protein